jgi:hypothetical protein
MDGYSLKEVEGIIGERTTQSETSSCLNIINVEHFVCGFILIALLIKCSYFWHQTVNRFKEF